MKDLEWFKEEVRKDGAKYPTYHDERDDLIKKMCSMHDILGLIDQIEQPEVTYQQALNKIAERHPLKPSDITWILDNHVASGGVEQPALPVVPEFVAEWFEENNKAITLLALLRLLSNVGNFGRDEQIAEWVSSLKGQPHPSEQANAQMIVARMYLDGYTVEEKKYYVMSGDIILLARRCVDCEIEKVAYQPNNLNHLEEFTEQEIEDFDERYFAFAVPVKRGDE